MNLMGQIDSISESKLDTTLMVIYDDYYNDNVYVEFNFKSYVDFKIEKRIVELWKEYQDKFNYSDPDTIIYDFKDEPNSDLVGSYTVHKIYYKPTLEGFMQFIERKIASKPKTMN